VTVFEAVSASSTARRMLATL